MPRALICSAEALDAELGETILWRDGVERAAASSAAEARERAREARPDIVVVDRDLPDSAALVASLRRDPLTRGISIVVLARGEMGAGEVELLAGGANAIFRLPFDPEWNERLARLVSVPARKAVRIGVYFEVESREGEGVLSALGMALNLSASGMLLESDFALEVGDVLDLRFRLPDSDLPVVGCGRIARRAGPRRFGLEFFGLEGDGAAEIRRFVVSAGEPPAAGAP